MRTKLTTRPSSLQDDGTLNLHVPHSWSELTQDQLRYVLILLTQGWEEWHVRTYLFARFAGIRVLNEKKDGWLCEAKTEKGGKVRFFLELWQVQSFCEAFDFVFEDTGAETGSIPLDSTRQQTWSSTITRSSITSVRTTTSSSICSRTRRAMSR